MRYVVYDAAGAIKRTGEVPESMLALQAHNGEFVVEGVADDTLHYILNGAVTDKMEITAMLSGTTISGLPTPATITIERARYDVIDGVAELSFNLPGTYSVLCEAMHHLPKTIQVTV